VAVVLKHCCSPSLCSTQSAMFNGCCTQTTYLVFGSWMIKILLLHIKMTTMSKQHHAVWMNSYALQILSLLAELWEARKLACNKILMYLFSSVTNKQYQKIEIANWKQKIYIFLISVLVSELQWESLWNCSVRLQEIKPTHFSRKFNIRKYSVYTHVGERKYIAISYLYTLSL